MLKLRLRVVGFMGFPGLVSIWECVFKKFWCERILDDLFWPEAHHRRTPHFQ